VDADDLKDIFEPYERLIEIEILGKSRRVPENNTLLRCLQYLSLESVSKGEFCWNGDCINCQVWIERDGKEKSVISCRAVVEEGMRIVRMHDKLSEAFDPE
jgi:predicted molibdopterin-dependent oxidoreductase YjgC